MPSTTKRKTKTATRCFGKTRAPLEQNQPESQNNKSTPSKKPTKTQDAGEYAGFDRDEFTSRSGGKPAAIRDIRARRGVRRVVMVGDGATDLEARTEQGAACLFVGYGGVVVRDNVAAAADWYVRRIDDLTEALSAGQEEPAAA